MPRPRLHLPEIRSARAAPAAGTAGAAAAATGATGATRPRGAIGADVYASLRDAVLTCTLRPGEPLSEQAVSDSLGVSRAPVRDAFRRLTAEGLLEVFPQRGSYVSRLSRPHIADAIFVREAIECQAAALAAAAPLRQRRALQAIVEWQTQAAQAGAYGQHLNADEDLHHQILEAAGHPHAWGPLHLARLQMTRIRHLAIPAVGSQHSAIEQHSRLVAAIVRGQAQRAVDEMREHIRAPLVYVDQIQQQSPEYFTA